MSTQQTAWILMKTAIEELHVHTSLPGYIVTDNACNFVVDEQQVDERSMLCSHITSLHVRCAEYHSRILGLRSKARTIVGYYKRSPHGRAELHDIQKTTGAKELGHSRYAHTSEL